MDSSGYNNFIVTIIVWQRNYILVHPVWPCCRKIVRNC
jgi:hypothetical protein